MATSSDLENIWTIERLVPGGRGLARLPDGRIGFATQVAPGDKIRVLAAKTHRQFVEASEWTLVEPANDRVHPECPHFNHCGGCDWMHLSRQAELASKRALLSDALKRVGKLGEVPPIGLVADQFPSTDPGYSEVGVAKGYRNRQRFHVSPSGKIGLFAEKSHQLVEIETCLISHPEVVRGLVVLREALARRPEVGVWLSEAEVRISELAPKLAVRLVQRSAGFKPELTRKFVQELEQSFDLVTIGRHRALETQRFAVFEDVVVEIPPAAFVQVNPSINAKLVAHVVGRSKELGIEYFADLYAGAGNFALPLTAAGMRGVALEQSRPAVTAATRQVQALKLDSRLQYILGDVATGVGALDKATGSRHRASETRPFDLVILDPPREGAKDVLTGVLRLTPQHIAYCACDPVSLARDLKTLTASGYQLTDVTIFDMFPRTHHFESVAWLSRGPLPKERS
ncbi:MAG: 23S rRNA (uracil(1939)-C(5))-methyltransferase RlmD [Polyangiaceae bacterium]|nr:23S rRNA (uracil(1939)-C(5))-methyltransferase RlmD [Polyangiaceae bacterium]